jgi:hypothetical protein
MYVVRGLNIFTPAYFIPSVYTKSGNNLVEVKEIYTKSGGVLRKVYNRNLWGPVGQQHPFWQYSMNPEFFDDRGVSYTTFWSTSGGNYSISGGACTISINTLSIITTTEDKTLSTNLVNGSTTAVVKNTNDLVPLTQTDIETGANVRWSVSGNGIQSNTTVAEILNATEIRLSRAATITQSSLSIRYQRTWNSAWFGRTRLQSQIPLQVSPGQTYRLQAAPTSGTTNSSWKFGIITAPLKQNADFFGTNSLAQEGPRYFDLNNNSWDVTIPSGHNWMRPMIVLDHSSSNYPTVMPRSYTFNWFRITRV